MIKSILPFDSQFFDAQSASRDLGSDVTSQGIKTLDS